MTAEDAEEVHQPTRADWLSNQIANGILTGDFLPGSRLDAAGLAKRFGVSRTPVREALRQLVATGLIDVKPRRGATVVKMTSAQIEVLFAAMAELEATCARLSAMTMTSVERHRLASLHDAMGKMVELSDEAAYAAANVHFHLMLYSGAHNTIIRDMAASLRRRLSPFQRIQFKAVNRLPHSHKEHGAVVAAIMHGDAGEAHAAMLRHVSLVEDAVDQWVMSAQQKTATTVS